MEFEQNRQVLCQHPKIKNKEDAKLDQDDEQGKLPDQQRSDNLHLKPQSKICTPPAEVSEVFKTMGVPPERPPDPVGSPLEEFKRLVDNLAFPPETYESGMLSFRTGAEHETQKSLPEWYSGKFDKEFLLLLDRLSPREQTILSMYASKFFWLGMLRLMQTIFDGYEVHLMRSGVEVPVEVDGDPLFVHWLARTVGQEWDEILRNRKSTSKRKKVNQASGEKKSRSKDQQE